MRLSYAGERLKWEQTLGWAWDDEATRIGKREVMDTLAELLASYGACRCTKDTTAAPTWPIPS